MKHSPALSGSIAMSAPEPNALNNPRIAMILVVSAIFWLLVWYGDTVLSMITIWKDNNTYTQCFLIPPISAWLIWQRRNAVAALDLRPDFRVLPLLAALGFCWLLGQIADVDAWQPFVVVLMIPLTVWAILGYAAVRTLAFPLSFLFFTIPFGDYLIPPMMEYTADFTVAALKFSGVPVYRDGQFFMIPSGSWSVVEACAGLRYLIASLTVGVLYAYLTYRSAVRRAIFVALSVIVPIVANWLRAYIVVMIGHLSENKYATGFDHLIGGWLFFGFVMFILFWLGSFFREDIDSRLAPPKSALHGGRRRVPLSAMTTAAVAVAGIVAVWPEAAERLAVSGPHTQPTLLAPLPHGKWQPVVGRVTNWEPHFLNASVRLHQTYRNDAIQAVLYVAYYRNQRPGAELITSGNVLVAANDPVWRNTVQTRSTMAMDEGELSFREAHLRNGSTNLFARYWYWVDGQHIANPYLGKLLQAKARLLGQGDDAAVVIVYKIDDDSPQGAEHALGEFIRAILPAVTRSLEYARDARPSS